jgi:glycosyltransferase involved in cell wall biosynthesis
MRLYTCTPAPFRGDHTFFARDSGLTCRGLQALGLDSRAIALGPVQEGDVPDLMRATRGQLESVDWWQDLQLQGVVLYAWGAAQYRQIARAIRASGAGLYVHCDSNGIFSPLVEWRQYWRALWPRTFRQWPGFLLRLGYRHSLGLYLSDWRSLDHLRQAHCLGAVTPIAEERLRRYCRLFGGVGLAERVALVPAPVASHFVPSPAKLAQVIAVGRWADRHQKRPELLVDVLRVVLEAHPTVRVVLAGSGAEVLADLMQPWSRAWRSRVQCLGQLRNIELIGHYQQSQVALCVSRFETAHLASAEAICCGCSIAGPALPQLPCVTYYASKNSGTVAPADDPQSIGRAVLSELALWESGRRNPMVSGQAWAAELHADRVAQRILNHLELNRER